MSKQENTSEELDVIFNRALRGKTITTSQGYILEWAQRRLFPELLTLIESEKTEHAAYVIGEDIDIPAEMEKVGRDFSKTSEIMTVGTIVNNHNAEQRKRAGL